MEKLTVSSIIERKGSGKPITMLTAYDCYFAQLMAETGIDIILVGDSLGMVVQGYESTLQVTVEDIIYHAKAVRRGAPHSFIVADMPFMSYQVSDSEAVANAGRMIKEAGANAVKIEGGAGFAPRLKKIVEAGIPVMGHIGLQPQWINTLGGYKLQGNSVEAAKAIVDDARAIEEAGVFSILLEKVVSQVSGYITEKSSVPTIGIGAGPACDGQVLVTHDIIGLFEQFRPKFAKRYSETGKLIKESIIAYRDEVSSGKFPETAHSYKMKDELYAEFLRAVEK